MMVMMVMMKIMFKLEQEKSGTVCEVLENKNGGFIYTFFF